MSLFCFQWCTNPQHFLPTLRNFHENSTCVLCRRTMLPYWVPKESFASHLLRYWSWGILLLHLSNRFCRSMQFCFVWKPLAPKTRHFVTPLEIQKVGSSNRRARKTKVALIARLKHGFTSQAASIGDSKCILRQAFFGIQPKMLTF